MADDRLVSALQGRYTLLRELGAGAMATVYLAEDHRHDRKVAIKILKPNLTALLGAERFLSEIKTTANLQHPHILPLFDSGEAHGFLFYVMPYVAGESLRDRLEREKQLSVDDAIAITRAVATALDYAHRHDVVHRDIKPDNILLHEGQPLVSDFGIALAVSTAGGDRLTGTGLSLGTPYYMSPEQAAGERDVDGRSDLYSLGCVTYEMLAGQPPFVAPTTHAVVAQILSETAVPLERRRPTVPRHLAAVVTRSLEKLPADRFESGAQLAKALDDEHFRWPPAAVGTGELTRSRRFVAAVTLAAVMAALAIWSWFRPVASSSPIPVVRLTFSLPEDQILPVGLMRSVLEISPNGNHLVYAGHQGRHTQLYLREVGDFQVRALPGTQGASEPFFSPDGDWVGFFADGRLKKVRIAGGNPIEITETPGLPYGASWGRDGTILYSLGGTSVWRVAAAGGTASELPLRMVRERSEQAREGAAQPVPPPLKWPRFLPGGKHALATVGWVDEHGRSNDAGVAGVIDLATGEFRPLFGGSRPYYLRSGHIVFDAGRESIRFVPFDLERLQVTGPVEPLVDNALRSSGSGTNFTVSQDGVLAYPTGGFERTLVLVDRHVRETPVGVSPRGFRLPRVSPDGKYVAVTVDPQPPHIWIVDLERERATRLTTDAYNLFADWSPDGTRLVFVRTNVDTAGIYQIAWPNAGEPVLVRAGRGGARWARDEQLFIDSWDERGDILLFDLRRRVTTDLVVTPANERQPSLSPDGNWVAYTSDATGIDEVYVIP